MFGIRKLKRRMEELDELVSKLSVKNEWLELEICRLSNWHNGYEHSVTKLTGRRIQKPRPAKKHTKQAKKK